VPALHDDVVIEKGAEWGRAWPVTSGGRPLDLSGWTVRAQVRERIDAGDVLHEWSTAAGNASTADSRVTLTATAATSRAWPWLAGVFDVLLIDPTGRVARIVEGTVRVSRGVTRDNP